MFSFFKGRVALYAILKAIGIKRGDEVIIPGFTCVVVPNAIIYLDATPVYIDIDPKTYNIDVSKLDYLLTSHSSLLTNPKAIIAQHTFGIPADMDKISSIAKKHNLYLIEDSCHAIGSSYKGKEVGTFGNAAFFSSQWSKPVTTGLGGWAVVNNEELKEKIETVSDVFIEPSRKEIFLLKLQYLTYSKLFKPSIFWYAQKTYRTLSGLGMAIGSSSNEELEYKMPDDYKKRMSNWQQKILRENLADITRVIDHRKWVVSQYEKLLPKIGIEPLRLPVEYDPVFLRYPVSVKNKGRLMADAERRKIELGDWFVSPVHPNLNGWEKVGYQKGMCPIAEDICAHVINFPTHKMINNREIEKIVNLVAAHEL